MNGKDAMRVLGPAEIEEILRRELPHWTFEGERGCIRRLCRTHGWKGTLMAVNAIGHLAEVAWHHPELSVAYSSVEIRLHTHDAKGITMRDIELARKIEEVLFWQPGQDGGALEGIPEGDARFAYLKVEQ